MLPTRFNATVPAALVNTRTRAAKATTRTRCRTGHEYPLFCKATHFYAFLFCFRTSWTLGPRR
eukprot:scaffold642799_cov13-Prasinocladus_malaysianus.AAC.1